MQFMVNIDVDDLDRAIGFYRAAFGLQLARRFSDAVAEMLGGSSPIYLLLKPPGTPVSAGTAQRRSYDRHWTPVHLDFVVEDIGVAVSAARSAGATLESDVQTHKWGRLALMADPFGNGFCLIQFTGRGYDEVA